ncbi:6649_t:CDS:10 [Paraglomus brasilianum]|uniref:6649_t:CDS:1 n=1 Tax=Paraglomus brasilianum TaxID=144538 RepID=A0A9N9BA53_9GLOM|nr:6649_t:CDS:10 [Paraglomus brasilianum]
MEDLRELIFNWTLKPNEFDIYLNNLKESEYSESGARILRAFMEEPVFKTFAGMQNMTELNMQYVQLTVKQDLLLKKSCKLIQKTKLGLHQIERNVPVYLQQILLRYLIEYAPSTDPSQDPIIRTYRWSIRSVYKDAPLFTKPVGSSPVHIHLEELYSKLTREESISQENRILSVQLAFELGRYYFAKGDFNKAAFYLENSVAAMEKLDDSEDYNNLCEINKERLIGFAQAATAMSGPQFHETSPIKRVDRLRAERNYEEIIPLLLNKGTKSLLSRSFRRSLVDEAVNCGQLGTAVKLAVCNSLNVADISADNMVMEIPVRCLRYIRTSSQDSAVEKVLVEVFQYCISEMEECDKMQEDPGSDTAVAEQRLTNLEEFVRKFCVKANSPKAWKTAAATGLDFLSPPQDYIARLNNVSFNGGEVSMEEDNSWKPKPAQKLDVSNTRDKTRKAIRSFLEEMAQATSNFTQFTKTSGNGKAEDILVSYQSSVKQAIKYCIKLKEYMAAAVLLQFIPADTNLESEYVDALRYIKQAAENEAFAQSTFLNLVWSTPMLEAIVYMAKAKGHPEVADQIIKHMNEPWTFTGKDYDPNYRKLHIEKTKQRCFLELCKIFVDD